MPSYLSVPIFIFQRDDKTLGLLTEMNDRQNRNVCVAIEMNKEFQDGSLFLKVNDIRSFHGRRPENIIYPIIQNNSLIWVEYAIRCKIDGVQQLAVKLTPQDAALVNPNMDKRLMASKYFKDELDLTENENQEINKFFKRKP